MQASCLFCQIVREELPAEYVYRDGNVIVIKDIQPQAPVHVLVIPRSHIESLVDVPADKWPLVAETLTVTQKVAKDLGIASSGYRIIANNGRDSGQLVPHLHWHLLGGGPLGALVG